MSNDFWKIIFSSVLCPIWSEKMVLIPHAPYVTPTGNLLHAVQLMCQQIMNLELYTLVYVRIYNI